MRIALAQLNYLIGDFDGNLQKMLKAIRHARDQQADLICFAELATCGYPPRDFLEFDDFVDKARATIERLKEESEEIGIIVGSPVPNPVIEGKDLFNAAFFLYEEEVKHVSHKALLPTYDIFDEYRYFEPGDQFSSVEFKGKRIALTVCEDIWNIGNENPLYTICPMDEIMPEKPDLMINISASPFAADHTEERLHVLRANVKRYKLPLFYINHVGAQTELIFDGGSTVMNAEGEIWDELPYFEESIRIYELDEVHKEEPRKVRERERIPLIHDGLILGIRDYFSKLGFEKAILGLSGGIDSSVVTVLAVEALGAENVHVLMMPSPFSSEGSITDSEQLVENLGITSDTIRIDETYESFLNLLGSPFGETEFDVTEENIQARIRAILLMAYSNKKGYILLNTSNKSELAVGYGTLYGDLCGGLSVIGDVYKNDVYQLARHINRGEEIIPKAVFNKPPSAELRPDQTDQDLLPPYDILDQILYLYIEQRHSPQDIIDQGFDEDIVRKSLRMVNVNEFKRYQTAPTLRVSSKAFGMGRRMPIVAKYLS